MAIPMSYPEPHPGPGMSVPITILTDMTSPQSGPGTVSDPDVRCPMCERSLGFPESKAVRADADQLIDACGRHNAEDDGGDWWSGIRVPR